VTREGPRPLRRGPSAAAELAARVDLLQLEPHAQPQAALVKAAVAQYRCVPFEREGRLYERRVRLRVRFQLQ